MTRANLSAVVLAAALVGLGAGPAEAQLVNPGFETGNFGSWTTLGDTAVIGALGSVNPDAGAFQARVTTESGSVSPGAIETFLGLTAGAIDGLIGGNAIEGSAIKQTITVNVGDTVTIRYNLLTNEFTPDALFNDTVFFCVVGPGGTIVKMADTFSAPWVPATGTIYFDMTGYRTFTHTFTAAGTVTVGIGIIDRTDDIVNSAVLIDGSGGPPPPTAGVTVAQSGGTTNVAEGGATDTYTVVLNSAPTAAVNITLNAGAQVTVSALGPFNPANWNVPQTVTVTAVDDALVEGIHTGTITHTAASADAAYNGIVIANVTVNITDNDSGPPPPPPPPVLPPPPPPPNEGDFLGSTGISGANEGSFGFGFAAGAVAGAHAVVRPEDPSLRGPFPAPSGGVGQFMVVNVAYRQGIRTHATAARPITPTAVGALVAGLALASAGALMLRQRMT